MKLNKWFFCIVRTLSWIGAHLWFVSWIGAHLWCVSWIGAHLFNTLSWIGALLCAFNALLPIYDLFHGLELLYDLLRGLVPIYDLLHGLELIFDLPHGLVPIYDVFYGLVSIHTCFMHWCPSMMCFLDWCLSLCVSCTGAHLWFISIFSPTRFSTSRFFSLFEPMINELKYFGSWLSFRWVIWIFMNLTWVWYCAESIFPGYHTPASQMTFLDPI